MGRSGFQCQFVSIQYVNDHAVAGCVLGFFVGTGHVRVRDPFLPATSLNIAAPFLRRCTCPEDVLGARKAFVLLPPGALNSAACLEMLDLRV